ncbi:hypothetical protein BDW75DRAFT_239423 [Aspergillus navahoensis]
MPSSSKRSVNHSSSSNSQSPRCKPSPQPIHRTVVELGANVTNVSLGDRIFTQAQANALCGPDRGGLQQYALLHADYAAGIPDQLSFDEFAALADFGRVIITASTRNLVKVEYLDSLAATQVVERKSEFGDVLARIREIVGDDLVCIL